MQTLERDLEISAETAADQAQTVEDRSLMPQLRSGTDSLVRPRKSSAKRLAWITERVILMMGVYRRDDYDNPDIFANTCIAVLETFPNAVIESVTHLASGLQTEGTFPPSVAEIKARAARSLRSLQTIELSKARKLHQPKPLEKPVNRSAHPTMDDLAAKYPEWLGPDAKRRTLSPSGKTSEDPRAILERYACKAEMPIEAIDCLPSLKEGMPGFRHIKAPV